MAEPSLLCVNCARPPPAHRRTWGRCTVCVARNLPSTYYCGEECMNAHWPTHKEYHKVQKERAEELRQGGSMDRDRAIALAEAHEAETTGSEYHKRFAEALAHMAANDHHASAKAWRKIIKEWPDRPWAYHNLALVMQRAGRCAVAAPLYLKVMQLCGDGTNLWGEAAAGAFDVLKTPDCFEMPKPEWWNDDALKALSARVVAVAPDRHMPYTMRARVLSGDAVFGNAHWNAGPRTAAEIKEAATWYRRAAMLTPGPSGKLRYDKLASKCDEFADPLLVEQEAETAAARAAAEAAAAEALKEAEAKATAAAEELLAEEVKAEQQASAKASKTKGKGKKGHGKR